jgi:hypothetical protein
MIMKRNKKTTVHAEQVVETPTVETQSVSTPEVGSVEAVVETQSAETKPTKTKKVRYAPKSVLQDTAVIRLLKPKAKGESGKSNAAERFNRLHKETQTVAEYIAAHKEAYQTGAMLARNDLRWDYEHGFISIEAPQS